MPRSFDVCIRGAGVVGRSLALMLARERLRVALVDHTAVSTPSASITGDVRAYALNARSKSLLDALRCWPDAANVAEVHHMQVKGDSGGVVRFDAPPDQSSSLAWIVDASALLARLIEASRFQPLVESVASPVAATLTVVCEGRLSNTRAELGVQFDLTPYPQQAIAARLHCQQDPGQTARQWFGQGEILALLPLPPAQGHRTALIWSVRTERAPALMANAAEDFCSELEQLSEGCLGRLTLASQRCVWPLQAASSKRWVGVRDGASWALAGDAAHAVHPLAGQGLNLGLADAAELARVLHAREYWRSVGDLRLLRQYERSRQAPVAAMAAATDAMQQLFSRENALLQNLRNWGMSGFDRSGLVKQWAMHHAMGL